MKCNSDNEFGPGICVSDIFDKAMLYAWPSGAIMIFKTPEVQNISVWKANTTDWNVLTAIWLQNQLHNVQMSDEYKDAGIIQGAVSVDEKWSPEKEVICKPGRWEANSLC